MEKQIVVNQIEVAEAGVVQVRIAKRIVDAGVVLSNEWHRTSFSVGGDIPAQIAAVNAHLAEMGWPAMPAGAVDTLTKHAAVAWTPERVAAAGNVLDEELQAKRAELVQIEAAKAAAIAAAIARVEAANMELARLTESANQIIAAAQAAQAVPAA